MGEVKCVCRKEDSECEVRFKRKRKKLGYLYEEDEPRQEEGRSLGFSPAASFGAISMQDASVVSVTGTITKMPRVFLVPELQKTTMKVHCIVPKEGDGFHEYRLLCFRKTGVYLFGEQRGSGRRQVVGTLPRGGPKPDGVSSALAVASNLNNTFLISATRHFFPTFTTLSLPSLSHGTLKFSLTPSRLIYFLAGAQL